MNRWDQKYTLDTYLFGTEANAFIKQKASIFKSGSTIAAYAEGEGRNAVYLALEGHEVTAYDYSKVGLDKAHQLAKEKKVSITTKLVNLEEDELLCDYYDGAILVFGHFNKKHQLSILNKIMNSISIGGYFIMEVYEESQSKLDTGGPKDIEHLYNAKQLLDWASNYSVIHFFTGETERNEGLRHTGVCRVVQLIIQK